MIFKSKFENGDLLKDKVTGLKGICQVIAFYSTGCTHYGIQQQTVKEDGSIPEWQWIDQSRIELVKKGKVSFEVNKDKPGGPSPSGPSF